jgi:predicted glycosyltransferase
VPGGVDLIDLPPLGMDDGHTVVSRDAAIDVDAARERRRRLIELAVAQTRPDVLLVELFPFGRKKFAGEILPMIRAARRQPAGARVACSLRDILVDARPDQQHHDDRARWLADRYFDAVLVHADPAFARLEDSFRPRRALRTPVHYTGFVVPQRQPPRPRRAAITCWCRPAAASSARRCSPPRCGSATAPPACRCASSPAPSCPSRSGRRCSATAAGLPGVTLLRHVPDMVAEMRRARASISQCGYNTALDLVVSGVPALVVPYGTATENEQRQRAQRLAALGAVQCLVAEPPTAAALLPALQALLRFEPQPAALALDGARRSALLLAQLAADAAAPQHGSGRSHRAGPDREHACAA